MASGAFAIPSLEALLGAGHEVVALVTQPDRESGRGQALAPPKVKPVAERHRVRVLQVPRVRAPEAQTALRELRPELQVVVAFGQILPRTVIDIAPRGTVNVHASLLPRLRGAAPIQWAIANGDAETGVTTMQIDEGLDTGPLLLARSLPIGPDETAAELEPRLARLGGDAQVDPPPALVVLHDLHRRVSQHVACPENLVLRDEGLQRGWRGWKAPVSRRAGPARPRGQ